MQGTLYDVRKVVSNPTTTRVRATSSTGPNAHKAPKTSDALTHPWLLAFTHDMLSHTQSPVFFITYTRVDSVARTTFMDHL